MWSDVGFAIVALFKRENAFYWNTIDSQDGMKLFKCVKSILNGLDIDETYERVLYCSQMSTRWDEDWGLAICSSPLHLVIREENLLFWDKI